MNKWFDPSSSTTPDLSTVGRSFGQRAPDLLVSVGFRRSAADRGFYVGVTAPLDSGVCYLDGLSRHVREDRGQHRPEHSGSCVAGRPDFSGPGFVQIPDLWNRFRGRLSPALSRNRLLRERRVRRRVAPGHGGRPIAGDRIVPWPQSAWRELAGPMVIREKKELRRHVQAGWQPRPAEFLGPARLRARRYPPR